MVSQIETVGENIPLNAEEAMFRDKKKMVSAALNELLESLKNLTPEELERLKKEFPDLDQFILKADAIKHWKTLSTEVKSGIQDNKELPRIYN
jgi:hypothetical protein